jgi:hypothetical protein
MPEPSDESTEDKLFTFLLGELSDCPELDISFD